MILWVFLLKMSFSVKFHMWVELGWKGGTCRYKCVLDMGHLRWQHELWLQKSHHQATLRREGDMGGTVTGWIAEKQKGSSLSICRIQTKVTLGPLGEFWWQCELRKLSWNHSRLLHRLRAFKWSVWDRGWVFTSFPFSWEHISQFIKEIIFLIPSQTQDRSRLLCKNLQVITNDFISEFSLWWRRLLDF